MFTKAPTKTSAVVLLSGGIDSTACVDFLLKQGLSVKGFFADYGQAGKHLEEESARKISLHYNIELIVRRVNSPHNFGIGEIIGRNAFLVFMALMYSGISRGILAIGVHSGTPYFDCSERFLKALKGLVGDYSAGNVQLLAPFSEWNKFHILEYCKTHQVPVNLTYSCEAGASPPCSACNSCLDIKLWKSLQS